MGSDEARIANLEKTMGLQAALNEKVEVQLKIVETLLENIQKSLKTLIIAAIGTAVIAILAIVIEAICGRIFSHGTATATSKSPRNPCGKFLAWPGIVPPSDIRGDCICLSWTPGMGLVFMQRRDISQNRIDNPPSRLHRILAVK